MTFVVAPLVSAGLTIALAYAGVGIVPAIVIGVLVSVAISVANAYVRGARDVQLIGWTLASLAASIPVTLAIGFVVLLLVLWRCQCLD